MVLSHAFVGSNPTAPANNGSANRLATVPGLNPGEPAMALGVQLDPASATVFNIGP